MIRSLISLALISAVSSALAQVHDPNVFMPETSNPGLTSLGYAHTNHLIYIGPPQYPGGQPLFASLKPSYLDYQSGIAGFHPNQIRTAYGDSSNGGGVIAIVDAYNYASSLKDFNTFASTFGLPKETSTNVLASTNKVFQVVYASGKKPQNNGGWAEEEALDIEWAHAMAPSAKIVLVEAASASDSALFSAIDKARSLAGVKQISMSWGGSEFSGETSYDSHFSTTSITYFVAAGDVGGAHDYPAESPEVIDIGGTSLNLNSSNQIVSETGWSSSGGGPSTYEPRPAFQNGIATIVGSHRGGPDISAVADPNTGVAVYDSTSYQGYVGWLVFGGTSVATPVCAGIANAGGAGRGTAEAAYIYTNTSLFYDVVSGSAGSYLCQPGWDYVTGWGSPKSTASL